MLRLIVVLLVMANAAFYAWHRGWLDTVLGAPTQSQRDPQRSSLQVNPERLIVVRRAASGLEAEPASPAASTAAPAPLTGADLPTTEEPAASNPLVETAAEARCLEAGPFTVNESRQAATLVGRVLPKGAWTTQAVAVPGLWLVYMGPYPDAETLERKQAELRRIKPLNFEEVRSPSSLAMGFSLGRYGSEELADAALETLRQRGVRTARVVNARPPMSLTVLKVAQANISTQARLSELSLPAGKSFKTCAK
jgi:malonyl CoA-acyl carrier protein transacylase